MAAQMHCACSLLRSSHGSCLSMQGLWDHLGQLAARFVGGPSLRRAVRAPRFDDSSCVLPSGEPCKLPDDLGRPR
ncbi:hypothetical protein CC86DRAFT_367978 [Ophiobolus disseminans]|uniref:Uncharacterized protein n=1 Tax=Ophiobolus disseminans TaxID=1469910 RepID=A0A6A7AA78_9PLEO|nr:hypothetical protein CC86DRAFT_367978 [Ophiobolus disseminans]